MKTFAIQQAGLAALGVACCLTMAAMPALAAPPVTAQTLIDRQEIQDLITRYYYNFGKENRENFTDFYADDAELILGNTHYKGKEGIMKAYSGGGAARPPAAGAAAAAPAAAGTPAAGAASGAAAPATPRPQRYTFNVTISNPLIVVHGNTATSQVVFSEYVQEKQGDPVTMRTQGKEYGTFVKINGQWRYKTRQIAGGSEPPADWKE